MIMSGSFPVVFPLYVSTFQMDEWCTDAFQSTMIAIQRQVPFGENKRLKSHGAFRFRIVELVNHVVQVRLTLWATK